MLMLILSRWADEHISLWIDADANADANADADSDAVTPSCNTRCYTWRSVPLSLGRSFCLIELLLFQYLMLLLCHQTLTLTLNLFYILVCLTWSDQCHHKSRPTKVSFLHHQLRDTLNRQSILDWLQFGKNFCRKLSWPTPTVLDWFQKLYNCTAPWQQYLKIQNWENYIASQELRNCPS